MINVRIDVTEPPMLLHPGVLDSYMDEDTMPELLSRIGHSPYRLTTIFKGNVTSNTVNKNVYSIQETRDQIIAAVVGILFGISVSSHIADGEMVDGHIDAYIIREGMEDEHIARIVGYIKE